MPKEKVRHDYDRAFPNSSLACSWSNCETEQINQALAELQPYGRKIKRGKQLIADLKHQGKLKFPKEKNAKFIYAGNEKAPSSLQDAQTIFQIKIEANRWKMARQ